MRPWLPRDVVHLIRNEVARSSDRETLLAARLVSRDWKRAVTVLGDPVMWCHHLKHDMVWRRTEPGWPFTLEQPLDLPPLVLDILLLNEHDSFREQLNWMELVGLAQRMVRKKDPHVEELEREAWLKICARINDPVEVDEHVVMSILLWGGGRVDWFCAGVQTLLFTPAFRAPVLALLKGAQRHWFPLEFTGAEIGMELLRMGVWCRCENSVTAPRGFIVLKRRKAEEEEGLWFTKPNAALDKWYSLSTFKAWRLFVGLRLHHDDRVLHNIQRVGDPDLLERMNRLNNAPWP